MSTAEKNERPEQHQDLRCQSGPSAKDSVIFSGGDYPKNYGADQQRQGPRAEDAMVEPYLLKILVT